MKIFAAVLMLMTNSNLILGQNEFARCAYRLYSSLYYCDFTIYNPRGVNNFHTINGTHITTSYTDAHVTTVNNLSGSKTTVVPTIICEKFYNLQRVSLCDLGIEYLNMENDISFKKCANILFIELCRNNITEIPENSFVAKSNLIVDLPADLFRELTDLETITLSNNNLTILHSDPFGYLPKLKYFSLINCQLEAIDENLIDNTGAIQLSLTDNFCVNETVIDNSATRYSMRIILSECFDNYANLVGQTTTTISSITSTTANPNLPPGCIGGNVDARICELEDNNNKLTENVEDLMKKNLELENQNKVFASMFENMQSQIDELKNRPCSCL
ncbi:unnamed protein product [Chironomus riparius]|uniref:Uncharacterized protein n=1 Tax=Chironomus riparius TaxID=315576 RepID=A0A9N9WK31_9DIPT|nr:unnamed protein product [Chironomus riparius]